MALPEKYPKFPTLAERQNMIAQLKEAAEKGDALSSSQHFQNYLDKLTALDKLMNQYSEIDEVFGIPPTLDASGQKKLLQALTDTAVAGETFLADAQRRIEEDPRVPNKQSAMHSGIPGTASQVQSMLARDYSPDRLERAKLAISRIVDRLQDDRIGLILFAGSSFVQLPITTDYVSAKMFLGSISTESVPVQGTAIGDAILTAARGFSAQSEKSRAIIVITDGENHEDDAVAAARQAAELGIRVYTVGVGSLRGEPIPKDGDLMKDAEGHIVVTRLDEETLQQVAKAGGGAYIHAGNEEFGLNPIIEDLRKLEAEEFSSVVFEEYDEQYMYFFALALALFVIEMLVGQRRAKRRLFE